MTDYLSFWLALVLSLGTLVFYLSSAFWNRVEKNEELGEFGANFNLSLPNIGVRENLFAITLVAAGTSLSTVFVFFLTAGTLFGVWLIICPILLQLEIVVCSGCTSAPSLMVTLKKAGKEVSKEAQDCFRIWGNDLLEV